MTESTDPRELRLTRIIAAPPERLYRVWTEQLPQWFGPHGMTTPVCEMDLRPGGIMRTVVRDPTGTEYDNTGVFLEVVPNARLVFTDAYRPGWQPVQQPFFTCITTFEAIDNGTTRYTARALHWTEEACRQHEAMGFYEGWGQSMDRFEQCVLASQ